MRYKKGEERMRRKREGEAMMVRGEEGREKSQSMGNLALEGRCRASKSEESGYDSDTRRSLEVLSVTFGFKEGGSSQDLRYASPNSPPPIFHHYYHKNLKLSSKLVYPLASVGPKTLS